MSKHDTKKNTMNLTTYLFLVRYSLAKPGAISSFRNVLKNQYLQEDELSERARNKTKKLINEAYQHVPWYKEQFDKIGLDTKNIIFPEYFNRLPVLTRKDLVENYLV